MDARTKALRSKSKGLGPVMQIGKAGVTPGTIAQLERELDQRGLVKIRILHAALPEEAGKQDRKAMARALADAAKAQLVDVVGNIIVVYREPK